MTHHPEHHEGADRPDVGYETTDANSKILAYAFAGLAGLLIFVFVAMWLLFVFFDWRSTEPQSKSQWTNSDYRPPEPRLQASPYKDLKQEQARERQLMQSYGWVNKASGIVRIPVGQAMDIVAKNGLPQLPPIGVVEDPRNPLTDPEAAKTPTATGTDTSKPAAPFGGPAGRQTPSSRPRPGTGPTQQNQPDGGNRNP
ncbi:MAG: hypothetical protein EHM61_10780 [Acidobacteria bacterium]|nr:MAG: hypothetical protein EHM61_10780 [Acidobacteriota bacterium]